MTDYKVGDFLYHHDHGVGRIRKVVQLHQLELVIDFEKRPSFTVSEKLAQTSTQRLSSDGFRALAYDDYDYALEILKEDPPKVIAHVLRDFPRWRAKTEDLNDYLSVYVKDWPSWWEITLGKLKESPFIDTSLSHKREYGLREEAFSLAEEVFERFNRLNRRGQKEKAFRQAKRVLEVYKDNQELSDGSIEAIKSFLLRIIERQEFERSDQLDALFRLRDVRWLGDQEVESYIQPLIDQDLRVYLLDSYPRTRIIRYLIDHADSKEDYSCLLTAICSDQKSVEKVVAWLFQKGDPGLLASAIKIALSQNIPPDLKAPNYPDLGFRLHESAEIVDSLTVMPGLWSEVVPLFRDFVANSVLAVQMVPEAPYPVETLLSLASALYDRIYFESQLLTTNLLESLMGPGQPAIFLIPLLNARGSAQLSSIFSKAIDRYLLFNFNDYSEESVSALFGLTDDEPGFKISKLVSIALDMDGDHPHLMDRAGELVAETLREIDKDLLINSLSDLEDLVRMGEDQPWVDTVNGFRELGYLRALEQGIEDLHGELEAAGVGGFFDPVIQKSVQDFLKSQSVSLGQAIEDEREVSNQYRDQIQHLEKRLSDQEVILRELRRRAGGGGEGSRYEERVRILRELAQSVAEFERFSASQEDVDPSLHAILIRLASLMRGHQVTPMEAEIGDRIPFDPKMCQMVGQLQEGDIFQGEVVVLERGYLIVDPQGVKRILKPALVEMVGTP